MLIDQTVHAAACVIAFTIFVLEPMSHFNQYVAINTYSTPRELDLKRNILLDITSDRNNKLQIVNVSNFGPWIIKKND